MKLIIFLLLICSLTLSYAGLIGRQKRGYLSRTGICPIPSTNQLWEKKVLNYFGEPVMLKGDDPPSCDGIECDSDSHCDANEKCCKNECGANVCTPSVRHPDPCSEINCPKGETCKIQKVKCIMPDCPDADAINRPSCVASDKVPPPLAPASAQPAASPAAPPMLAYADPNLAGAEAPSTYFQESAPAAPYDSNAAVSSPVAPPTYAEQQVTSPEQTEAMYPQQPIEEQSTAPVTTY